MGTSGEGESGKSVQETRHDDDVDVDDDSNLILMIYAHYKKSLFPFRYNINH